MQSLQRWHVRFYKICWKAQLISFVSPESQGLVCASTYILLLILFIPFPFSHLLSASVNHEGLSDNPFPHQQVSNLVFLRASTKASRHSKLSMYLSSVLSLLIATLLGFLDDVFDIRWRHKLPIPIIASIPLLLVYYSEQGNTNVVVPIPLRWLLGPLIKLGKFLTLSFAFTYSGSRSTLLSIYGSSFYVCDEQYKHTCWC